MLVKLGLVVIITFSYDLASASAAWNMVNKTTPLDAEYTSPDGKFGRYPAWEAGCVPDATCNIQTCEDIGLTSLNEKQCRDQTWIAPFNSAGDSSASNSPFGCHYCYWRGHHFNFNTAAITPGPHTLGWNMRRDKLHPAHIVCFTKKMKQELPSANSYCSQITDLKECSNYYARLPNGKAAACEVWGSNCLTTRLITDGTAP